MQAPSQPILQAFYACCRDHRQSGRAWFYVVDLGCTLKDPICRNPAPHIFCQGTLLRESSACVHLRSPSSFDRWFLII